MIRITWTTAACALKLKILFECRWAQWLQVVDSFIDVNIRCWNIFVWMVYSSTIAIRIRWTTLQWKKFKISKTLTNKRLNIQCKISSHCTHLIVKSSSIDDHILGCSNDDSSATSLSLSFDSFDESIATTAVRQL